MKRLMLFVTFGSMRLSALVILNLPFARVRQCKAYFEHISDVSCLYSTQVFQKDQNIVGMRMQNKVLTYMVVYDI